MTVFYFEDRPRAARNLKKTLEKLGGATRTPPAIGEIVNGFCASVEAGKADLREAEATLARITAWRSE